MTSIEHIPSSSEVITAIEEIYTEIKQITREIRPSDHFVNDLGVDSVATLQILVALETRFEVSLVDNPKAVRVTTVEDLIALLDAVRGQGR